MAAVKSPPKARPHYVSNVDLYKAYCDWYKEIVVAESAGLEPPECPRYIAESIIKIATRLSYRPNFLNYSFREEMIADGIENVFRTIRNFNPERSTNPFAFITTVCFNAFIRRIQTEQKQTAIKSKLILDLHVEDMLESVDDDETGQLQNSLMEYLKEHSYIAGVQAPAERKKNKKVLHEENLEDFMKPENE